MPTGLWGPGAVTLAWGTLSPGGRIGTFGKRAVAANTSEEECEGPAENTGTAEGRGSA